MWHPAQPLPFLGIIMLFDILAVQVRTLRTKNHGSPQIPWRGRKRRCDCFDVTGICPVS
jgi:hypothetical protein